MKYIDKSKACSFALAFLLAGASAALANPSSGGVAGDSPWLAVDPGVSAAPTDPIVERLQEKFSGSGPLMIADVAFDRRDVGELYRLSGYRLFWIDRSGTANVQARSAIEVLAAAEAEGLRAQDYAPGVLGALIDDARADDPHSLVRADVALTAAVLRYAEDLHIGRVEPSLFQTTDLAVDVDRPDFDRLTQGAALVRAEDPATALERLRPADPAYAALRQALAEARSALAAQAWEPIPPGPTLRIGDRDDRVPLIRDRMRASGDFAPMSVPVAEAAPRIGSATVGETPVDAPPEVDPLVYDAPLADAVEAFQARHNLVVDGIVGPATLGAMNQGPADRVAAILGTMERLRWHPQPMTDTRIEVNIAAQRLHLFEEGDLIREMRVVVGRPSRPTPLFSSALTWLEWNPTWTMPVSIAERDYLDRLRDDPTYLADNGYTLYSSWSADRVPVDATRIDWSTVGRDIRSFMIRQSPGPNNALGKVKFMMANSFSVYLHDTPSRHLFNRDQRLYSSGCVRVQDPMWLAEYLLKDNAYWQRIREGVLNSWQTTRVNLDTPMPLHLLYETAEVGPTGDLIVYPDAYGLDSRLTELLDELRGPVAQVADAS